MSGNVCFVDTETTGLHPDRHHIWEVALITPNGDEHVWQFPVDEMEADPFALQIGGYWERRWPTVLMTVTPWDAIYNAHTLKSRLPNTGRGRAVEPSSLWARHFQDLTADCHLAGAVVSFDEERLRRLLWSLGVQHRWHYHLIDVEALAAGWLMGREDGGERVAQPPWDSNALSRAVGVNPDDFDRHTALGDARWAKAIYEAVMVR